MRAATTKRLAIVALFVMLAACSGGGSGKAKPVTTTTTRSTTTTTKPAKQFTPAELQAAQLTVQDFPVGWSVDPQQPDPKSQTGGMCNGPSFGARAQTSGSTTEVDTAFVKDPAVGPQVLDSLVAFPDVEKAKGFMLATQQAIAACPQYTTPAPGSPNGAQKITVSQLSFPNAADETIAARQASDGAGSVATNADIAYVRLGNVVVCMAYQSVGTDTAALQGFTGKQIDKLRPLVG